MQKCEFNKEKKENILSTSVLKWFKYFLNILFLYQLFKLSHFTTNTTQKIVQNYMGENLFYKKLSVLFVSLMSATTK